MPEFDLPIEALRTYRPPRDEPPDFDLFWKQTLADARRHDVNVRCVPVDSGLATVDTFDVTFAGYGGHPVHAWLIVPRNRTGRLPCYVQYVGYGGGRGHVTEHLLWASAGYAHLVMDARGQGADTPDPVPADGGEPAHVTRGSQDPATYYYRRLFTDAVRCVEAARTLDRIDPAGIVVGGVSQGGGIGLAVAALDPAVTALLCDVPFLCHWPRAVRLALRPPYADVADLCARLRHRAEAVLNTLRYFDGLHFAARATAPAVFSAALRDQTCPPSTVFAAYNHYAGPKHMIVFPFNDHEGGGAPHAHWQTRHFATLLAGSAI
ncbi:acetylxylan esterase [Dactylosporangium sp. NPDC051541]|uniref:acetylxylan esterase n=1 Tax=Dactylosporangium sp. NPDC051541 TaxID=3363977 RepID=UPI00379895A7